MTGRRAALLGIAGLAIVLLASLYVRGALCQASRVNTDPTRSDQGSYLSAAARMRATHFRYLGDRNRMPLYPALQAVFAAPDERDPLAAFERAKRVNILLSLLLLAALVPIVRAWLPPRQAATFMLITGFTVFMIKAGWVQAELLFYFLTFAVWLVLIETLRRPSATLGVLAGVLTGIAYLTKASVLPTIVLWVVWSGLAALADVRRRDRPLALRRLAAAVAAVAIALAVVFPYLADNKRIFGRWFYNVNVDFYAWCDSWDEASRGVKAHGAMEHWPTLPPEEIPSPRRYLETHTAGQIAERLLEGSRVVLRRAMKSYGYFGYLFLYGGLAIFLLWRNRSWAAGILKRNRAVAGFVGLYFLVSFLLVAWYVPIAAGNRFLLAHFLPLLFTISFVSARAPETYVAGRPVSRDGGLALLILILGDIPLRLLPQTGWLNGGH